MAPEQPKRRIARAGGILVALSAVLGTTFAAQAHGVGHRAAATPTYGGTYTYRLTDPPDCLDPQKTSSASSDTVDGMFLDELLSVDKKGRYVGDLATSYKVSNHGKTITFFLRKGVRFSNGDPFTASDVKFTFDRAVNPATKSPVSGSLLAGLKSTTVVNKYEVRLNMSAPYRPLLLNIAGPYLGILDKKSILAQGNNTCTKPIGTGPYKIQSTGTAFSDIKMVANKYHNFAPSWIHNKGQPYITKMQWKTVNSDSTAVSELLTGGIDMMGIPGTQLSRVKGNKNIVLRKFPYQSANYVEINAAHPPFNNKQVRKAFAEIINRSAIVKAALGGQGKALYGPLPSGIPDYYKGVSKFMPKFNISDAAKIIQTYHATGPYTLMTFNEPPAPTMAEIIQQAAAQAGMKLTIDLKASYADFVPAGAAGNFDILLSGYGYNDPDALYLLLDSSQAGANGLNWSNLKDPTLDTLLEKGRKTLNQKKAAAIYAQAQVRINKDLDFIGTDEPASLFAIRSDIKGWNYSANGGLAYQDLYIKSKP